MTSHFNLMTPTNKDIFTCQFKIKKIFFFFIHQDQVSRDNLIVPNEWVYT